MAAAYLNLEPSELLTLSVAGEIPCMKTGISEKDFIYPKAAVNAWLEDECKKTMAFYQGRKREEEEIRNRGLFSRMYSTLLSKLH